VRPHLDGEARPTEPAAFHPSVDEIAALAREHVAAGGTLLSFGRACEGEPTQSTREIEEAVTRVRAGTRDGTVHVETNGAAPVGLRRLAKAGVESVTVRMASARASTYETLHGPVAYRFADVRATLRAAAELRLSLSVLVLVHPGIFDRDAEVDALVAILAEAPEGTVLLLRDLHTDPLRALHLLPAAEPMGVAHAVSRLRDELPHVRVGAFVRPLARVPNVP
jgi:pyruvate-formate lyase-activating enzyme